MTSVKDRTAPRSAPPRSTPLSTPLSTPRSTPTSGDGAVLETPAVRPAPTSPESPRPTSRRRPWKTGGAFIRDQYGVTLQLGFVLALAVLLGLTQMRFAADADGFQVTLSEQETVTMEMVKQTQQDVAPPPPPRPAPPVEVANDQIVETQALDFDASLDLDQALDVSDGPPPPPPPPPEEGDEVEEEIFVVVEEQPVLIGGLQSLFEEIRYPRVASKAGIEGRVIVQFVVNEEGRVTDAMVARGRHPTLDKEALRVIQQARFTPGMQRGRAVKVRMTIPVMFTLRPAN